MQVVLEEETSALASKHAPIRPDMSSVELKSCMQCSLEDLKRVADIYKYLIRFPPNYLSKKSKDDLIIKALNADIFINFGDSQNLPPVSGTETCTAFRVFLSKSWNEQPSKLLGEIVRYVVDFIVYDFDHSRHRIRHGLSMSLRSNFKKALDLVEALREYEQLC